MDASISYRRPADWRWWLRQTQDPLLGRQAITNYSQLVQSQYWTPGQLAAAADRKLAALLRQATRHVPFYRELVPDARLTDFRPLPRTALQHDDTALLADNRSRLLWTLHSSGTTGQRVTVKRDPAMQDMSTACAWLGDCWGAEIAPTDRQVCLWGDPREHGARDTLKNRLSSFYHNRYILGAFMVNAQRARQVHRLLWRLRPRLIYGYPTSLMAYARFAGELGLQPPPVAKVLPVAEHCYPQDAEVLRAYFGAPVLERYGSHEMGCIAHQCEHGTWHLHSGHVLLEVLRDDGSIAGNGAGALLCTSLSNYSMPLIRYDIGDYAELCSSACPCGRGLPTFRNLEGRLGQFVFCPDGRWITSHGFLAPLRHFEIGSFQLRQEEPGRVIVLLAHAQLDSAGLAFLQAEYEKLHGGTLRVDFEYVDEIPLLPNGKRSRVQCLLPRPDNVVIS